MGLRIRTWGTIDGELVRLHADCRNCGAKLRGALAQSEIDTFKKNHENCQPPKY